LRDNTVEILSSILERFEGLPDELEASAIGSLSIAAELVSVFDERRAIRYETTKMHKFYHNSSH
jgi:hypothetical protein